MAKQELHGLERVFAQLDGAPAGLHDLAPPSAQLPSGLPEQLIELYALCDGGRLFHDGLEIHPAAEVVLEDGSARFAVLDGEPVVLDAKGRVWRHDASLDDDICEGSRLDRWLAGIADAIGLLYDGDGEFDDNLFDDDGELLPEIAERQLRAQLKRDPNAPGPRWRLAHAMLSQDGFDEGRTQLEEVVAKSPEFAWAWLDLARLSERTGELGGATDEARAAADAARTAKHPQAGYFFAQVARLAARAGDEAARAEAAAQAAQLAPQMKADQLEGVRDSLENGDTASARGLLELLRAVWPRDLDVLALARTLQD